MYDQLTPDSNWYDNLKAEVAQLNAAAVNAVGRDAVERKNYLRPLYQQAIAKYPQHNSVYLRQPEATATVPIYRNAQMVNDFKPGVNGFVAMGDTGPYITIDPNLNQGRQTKTAIHELAHNQLGHVTYNEDLSNAIKEFQAEAVARGVRERLGALSPNDQTASATYVAGHLLNLAGSGLTPAGVFAAHRDAIAQAVNVLAPQPAQPFRRMVPQLYQDFTI